MRTTDTPKSHEPRHSSRHVVAFLAILLGGLLAVGIVHGTGWIVQTVTTAIEEGLDL